ncbi:uncharacterized protein METZ01_LOCUS171323 [marine metagenome]|uniref:Uncharacterized protein n=1 Tax=marine metagenome TaxID=408172 RepID=A0A382BXY6_9ZZZZ
MIVAKLAGVLGMATVSPKTQRCNQAVVQVHLMQHGFIAICHQFPPKKIIGDVILPRLAYLVGNTVAGPTHVQA